MNHEREAQKQHQPSTENVPTYRLECCHGFTLAWDVARYGEPNEENVRRFLERFRDKLPAVDEGPTKVIDQTNGQAIVEVKP